MGGVGAQDAVRLGAAPANLDGSRALEGFEDRRAHIKRKVLPLPTICRFFPEDHPMEKAELLLFETFNNV